MSRRSAVFYSGNGRPPTRSLLAWSVSPHCTNSFRKERNPPRKNNPKPSGRPRPRPRTQRQTSIQHPPPAVQLHHPRFTPLSKRTSPRPPLTGPKASSKTASSNHPSPNPPNRSPPNPNPSTSTKRNPPSSPPSPPPPSPASTS